MTALDDRRRTAGAGSRPESPRPSAGSTAEAVADFRLACVSRAIDDREIALQKQSRVFFQISGAGHEALLLGLARQLRPGYDWFFPYYRDQALVLGLGVDAVPSPAAGGRLGRRPGVGRPPDAGPLGPRRAQHRHPVEPDRQPVPARGRLRRGRPLHRPGARDLPGCVGPRRRAHLRLARRGGALGGRVLGEPEHRVHACTCRCSTSWPTTATPSRCPPPTRRRRRSPSWCGASGASRSHRFDGSDYFEVRKRARRGDRPRPGRRRPGADPRRRHPPVLALGADTQSKYRRPTSWPTRPRTTRSSARGRRWSPPACSPPSEADGIRAEAARDGGRGGRRGARRAPGPTRRRSPTTCRAPGRRRGRADRPRRRATTGRRWARPSTGRCTS